MSTAFKARMRTARTLARPFIRWCWLYVTGRTAYRFAPFYRTQILPWGPTQGGVPGIVQANGLRIPEMGRPANLTDWREALKEAIQKAEG